MDNKKIINQTIDTVYNLLENSNLKITKETNSEEIAEWTSLKHVLILNELESIFKITFDFEDILELTTIEEISNKITELKNGNN